ncbi:DNA polymerase lambda, partial [Mucuna pruriens]
MSLAEPGLFTALVLKRIGIAFHPFGIRNPVSNSHVLNNPCHGTSCGVLSSKKHPNNVICNLVKMLRLQAESKGFGLDDTGLFLATHGSGDKRGAKGSASLKFDT